MNTEKTQRKDEIAWLEYRILTDIYRLRELKPDHVLVITVRAALEPMNAPKQLQLPLGKTGLMANQAE